MTVIIGIGRCTHGSSVSDGVDLAARGTSHAKVVVDLDGLTMELVGEFLDERLDERVHGDAGRPEGETRGNLADLGGGVRVLGILDGDGDKVGRDLLHASIYEERGESDEEREVVRRGRESRLTGHDVDVVSSEAFLRGDEVSGLRRYEDQNEAALTSAYSEIFSE